MRMNKFWGSILGSLILGDYHMHKDLGLNECQEMSD